MRKKEASLWGEGDSGWRGWRGCGNILQKQKQPTGAAKNTLLQIHQRVKNASEV